MVVIEATEIIPNKKIKPIDFLLPAGWVAIADAPAEVKSMLGMGTDEEE
jgi:hypothetical protein